MNGGAAVGVQWSGAGVGGDGVGDDRGPGRAVRASAAMDELERRIRERLAAGETACRLRQDRLREARREMGRRLTRYTAVADRLMAAVLRPAMEKLAACFAGIQPTELEQTRHTCACRFPHTARFPVTAAVELGVTRDGDAQTVAVEYTVQILPVFHPINARARLDMALDEVDERRVADWAAEQVLAFVDSYLRLETVERCPEA
jgi:hypothetical protein